MITSPYHRFVRRSVRIVATAIVAMGVLGIAFLLLAWIAGLDWNYPWLSLLMLLAQIALGIFVRRLTGEALSGMST
jgi:uncharacterized protein YggT (Ycf19 family)